MLVTVYTPFGYGKVDFSQHKNMLTSGIEARSNIRASVEKILSTQPAYAKNQLKFLKESKDLANLEAKLNE